MALSSKIPLICFSILLASTVFAEEFELLAEVESEYDGGHLTTGIGSLIVTQSEGANRYFILTASHVSQGKNQKLRVRGEPIELVSPLARISDSQKDIELMEVKPPPHLTPLAHLIVGKDHNSILLSSLVYNENESNIGAPKNTALPSIFRMGAKWNKETQNPFHIFSFLLYPRSIHPSYDLDLAENPSWLTGKEPGLLDLIEEGAYGGQLFTLSAALIKPGMSGAPLLQPTLIDGRIALTLDGVATQYLRFGSRSYFASADNVVKLLRQYFAGHRGAVNHFNWRAINGSLQRTFCLDWNGHCLPAEETSPAKGPSGGGVRGDGGGNVTSESFVDPTSLRAPFLIDGEEVHAFRVKRMASTAKSTFYIEFNLAALDFYQRHRDRYQFEMVTSDFSAIDIFANRYRQDSPRTYPFEIKYDLFPSTFVRVHSDRLDFQVRGPKLPNGRSEKDSVRDLLQFSLNARGGLITETQINGPFKPVIVVYGSKTNLPYYVDIRQVFFLDLTEVPTNQIVYSKMYHLPSEEMTSHEFVEAAYFRGGLINLRQTHAPLLYVTTQLYEPRKKGLLNFFFDPILNLIDPITED